MRSNLLETYSVPLLGESMAMMERTIREVCEIPDLGLFDHTRLVVNVTPDRVETVVLDGKPVLQFWPIEVAHEVLEDKVVLRATRKWRKL